MPPLWEIFWFFLPAGVANMAPMLASRLPLLRHWNTPLDFGLVWHGQRVFGENKTWRGLIFGTLVAVLVGLIQYRFIAFLPESTLFIVITAGAMGFGALVGDAVASFFKRQSKIPPGHSWIPFDQTDYIIGGLIFVYPFVQPSFSVIIMTLLLYFGLHIAVSYLGYLIGFKKTPI
jgi:CDP-2,3-bis-(O-geranylgeranyl)-sn-glycerol synthase